MAHMRTQKQTVAQKPRHFSWRKCQVLLWYIFLFQKQESHNRDFHFPCPVVRILPSNAGGAGSVPGWGSQMPHASQPKNQSGKQKQYCNKFKKTLKIILRIIQQIVCRIENGSFSLKDPQIGGAHLVPFPNHEQERLLSLFSRVLYWSGSPWERYGTFGQTLFTKSLMKAYLWRYRQGSEKGTGWWRKPSGEPIPQNLKIAVERVPHRSCGLQLRNSVTANLRPSWQGPGGTRTPISHSPYLQSSLGTHCMM